MINFFDLDIKRAAVHRLIEKDAGQPHASIVESNELLALDENVVYTMLERLSKAAEKKNKTFDLSINDTHQSSFFGYASEISELDDNLFIRHSIKISQLLAQAQVSSRFPGGYVVVLDAVKSNSKNKVCIVVKAELHDALIYYEDSLRLLENVFMSPSQKLFKFGMIYQYDEHEKLDLQDNLEFPNDSWGAMIYDEQFRIDSKPAEYFFKDFLGFSTDSNGLIQSKRFYDKTENFIQNYYEDFNEKQDMLTRLNETFIMDDQQEIETKNFSERLLGKEELKKQYENEVVAKIPEKIEKNPQLIKSNLSSKKITFPGNIKISGPTNNVEANVEIITDDEDLKNLTTLSSSYTIIKVAGKPYTKD
ncbi:nucleoid-associated protein [Candidatus Kapabacteria bacterium]|nr:nucleoid-associated protein [Candidatus Kapabacteria bacterium]